MGPSILKRYLASQALSIAVPALVISSLLYLLTQSNMNFRPRANRFDPGSISSSPLLGCDNYHDLYQLIEALEQDNTCLDAKDKSLLSFEVQKGHLLVPKPFESTLKQWLGNDSKLYAKALAQSVLHVFNHFTRTTTAFNPLRASRPLPKSQIHPHQFVMDFLEASKSGCDFCSSDTNMAEDLFGKMENEFAAAASNSFKVSGHHSLVFPKRHSGLDLRLEEFIDVFALAKQWFHRVHAHAPPFTHPMMIFDFMPHAGASQAHPHFHLMMGKGHYDGAFRSLTLAQSEYQSQKGSNYWTDYVNLHVKLGLGLWIGKAVVIVPLDARKDHEFMILSSDLNEDWILAFHFVIKTYVEKLEVFCWSSGFALPPISTSGQDALPMMAQIGSRGSCQSMTSDVSSFELYLMNNVNSNPFKTISALKETKESLS